MQQRSIRFQGILPLTPLFEDLSQLPMGRRRVGLKFNDVLIGRDGRIDVTQMGQGNGQIVVGFPEIGLLLQCRLVVDNSLSNLLLHH